MNKLFLFLLSAFITLISCREKDVQIPSDVLDQKEMTEVLTDIHLAQGAFSAKGRSDTLAESIDSRVDEVLLRHKVEREHFLSSLKYYSAHPDILQEIYDSVITGLLRMQGETEGLN